MRIGPKTGLSALADTTHVHAARPAAGPWIAVTERMPPDTEGLREYLVATVDSFEHRETFVATWERHCWLIEYGRVTHWAEIRPPELP